MSDTVGRADYELRAPVEGLKQDLQAADAEVLKQGAATEAAFTKRASKWGPAISSGLKAGIKVVGASTTAMLAIAAKGGEQLIAIQNDYQSATGASAEEARRAGKVINQVAGSTQQSLESVAAAAIAVKTDLGATGDEADDLTKRFAVFGRVTKQEPVAAVKAFDDILDAWNLEASDSQKIMDALVVSSQKYGGAVADDQDALAKLAPALKAMNGTWEDAIALIDLAKASGLETTDMIGGLTKALGKVKSPAELQRLIDDISKTEDPFLRAQKAADLFGQKAGPKLANALAGKTLDDFRIDMDSVTGATEKASDALDQGFGAQARKKLSEWGATLRGLGADWGPVVTGAGGFLSLLGTIGADELFKKFGPAIVEAMKRAGKAGGEALIDAAGTATGAAGTIFGNVIADPIAAALDPDRNSLLGKLVRKAGAKIAAVYLAAEIFATTVSQTVAAAWDKVAGSAVVTRAAGLAGGKAALAFVAGIAIAIPAALASIHGQVSDALTGGINDAFGQAARDALASGDQAAIASLRANLQGQLDQVMAGVDPLKGPFGGGRDPQAIRDAIALLDGAISRSAPELRDSWWREMEAVGMVTAPAIAAGANPPLSTRLPIMLQQALAKPGKALRAAMRAEGNRAGEGIAQGILEARQKPVDAFDRLKEMLKNAMSPMKERSRLLGQLVSKELAAGLKSKDPAVRAQARATKQYIIDRLTELKTGSGHLTKEQAKLVAKGLHSKDPDIRAAARAIRDYKLNRLKDMLKQSGPLSKAQAKAVEEGLKSKNKQIRNAAEKIREKVTRELEKTKKPAGAAGAAAGGEYIARLKAVIQSATIIARFRVSSSGGGEGTIGGRAKGGPVNANQPVFVGEEGTELWIPRVAGTVIPHDVIMDALRSMLPPGFGARSAVPASPSVSSFPRGPMTTTNSFSLEGGIHLHGIGSDVSPARAQQFAREVLDTVARGFREGSARRGFSTTVRP